MNRTVENAPAVKQARSHTPAPHSLLSQLLAGALAGFAATAPMSLAMKLMQMILPWWEDYALPPRQITKRIARKLGLEGLVDKRDEQFVLMSLGHFGYGAAAGSLYPLFAKLPLPAPLKRMGYGLLVWFLSYMGWLPEMRILQRADKRSVERNLLMIVAHLVWGGATGLAFERLEGE